MMQTQQTAISNDSKLKSETLSMNDSSKSLKDQAKAQKWFYFIFLMHPLKLLYHMQKFNLIMKNGTVKDQNS